MTPLRRRMTEELQLRGYAARTIQAYLGVVAQLARFYHTSPDVLTEAQVRDYLLHLSTVRKLAPSSFTLALCGIKFLYEQTLHRQWTVLEIARPVRAKPLPVVLSREEVRCVLAAVRSPTYRVCLTLIYACGLRLLEGLRLQVPEIDGQRKLVHIRGAKGGKDRLVPIPDAALVLVRDYWRAHRDPVWVFPASARVPCITRRGRAAVVRSIRRRSSAPSAKPSKPVASENVPMCTRCGIATPPISSKPACRSSCSRSIWGIRAPRRRRSTRT